MFTDGPIRHWEWTVTRGTRLLVCWDWSELGLSWEHKTHAGWHQACAVIGGLSVFLIHVPRKDLP